MNQDSRQTLRIEIWMKDNMEWYRARFAGFSKTDARSTCDALKRMSLECIAMAAE